MRMTGQRTSQADKLWRKLVGYWRLSNDIEAAQAAAVELFKVLSTPEQKYGLAVEYLGVTELSDASRLTYHIWDALLSFTDDVEMTEQFFESSIAATLTPHERAALHEHLQRRITAVEDEELKERTQQRNKACYEEVVGKSK